MRVGMPHGRVVDERIIHFYSLRRRVPLQYGSLK